jgi:hypothetical protein
MGIYRMVVGKMQLDELRVLKVASEPVGASPALTELP